MCQSGHPSGDRPASRFLRLAYAACLTAAGRWRPEGASQSVRKARRGRPGDYFTLPFSSAATVKMLSAMGWSYLMSVISSVVLLPVCTLAMTILPVVQ